MPPVGFEPTISTGERPKTYALHRAAIREKQALIIGAIKTLLSLYHFITFGSPQASCPKYTTVSGCNYNYNCNYITYKIMLFFPRVSTS